MPGKPGEKKKNAKSALEVKKGVEGGHDGMPGDLGTKPGNVSKNPARNNITTSDFISGILAGDKPVLAKAITLIESNAASHQQQVQEVLTEILPKTGNSIRIGITGIPGAGKSTFIETFGCYLTGRNHKVAVLAVDPSSSVSKGSILGDKTRMEKLARDPNAFIRPSPSGGTLGGVARKTRETILLFEAAGYDVILVETIGVGQSEITVRSMVDFFLLVLIAGAGDELQGIKKGVMELADAILINKADGDNVKKAIAARADYEQALHYLQPATEGWKTSAYSVSALEGTGIENIWNIINEFKANTLKSGVFDSRRKEQNLKWVHTLVEEQIKEMFFNDPDIKDKLPHIEKQVTDGVLPPTQAALKLLEGYKPDK